MLRRRSNDSSWPPIENALSSWGPARQSDRRPTVRATRLDGAHSRTDDTLSETRGGHRRPLLRYLRVAARGAPPHRRRRSGRDRLARVRCARGARRTRRPAGLQAGTARSGVAGPVVEENNLQVQITSLRKLLGPQAIATVPGRGYRLAMARKGAAAAEAAGALPRERAVRQHRPPKSRRCSAGRRHRRTRQEHSRARPRHDRRPGGHRQDPPGRGRGPRARRHVRRRHAPGRARAAGRSGAGRADDRTRARRHDRRRTGQPRAWAAGARRTAPAARARQLRARARGRRRLRGAAAPQRTRHPRARDQPGTAAPSRRARVPPRPAVRSGRGR